MSGAVALARCPECAAAVAAGELFCEGCGADLSAVFPGADGAGAGADGAGLDGAGVDGAGAGAGVDGAGAGPQPVAAAGGGDDHVGDDHSGDEDSGAGAGDPDAVREVSPDLTAPVTACPDCGGRVAGDGYCEQCGTPAPKPRDHWTEQPAAWVAGMCDRGVRHARNEDAMALAATARPGGFAALVVCDGVSSSSGSDVASLAAARAARDVLAADRPAPDSGNRPGEGGPGGTEAATRTLAERLVEAGLTAHAQVVAAAGEPPRPNPPSCTFVAAAVLRAALVVGWVGDSRGYWLPDGGDAVQLSVDDSWATEQMALGATREEAENSPQAHAITRWLGVDSPQPVPRTAALTLDSPGWVLLCSDGLWNYCSPPEQLRSVLEAAITHVGGRPEAVAAALVAWATAQGGHDNITVALARVDGQALPGGR